ncbi:hypothetical protein [Clostridium intestinale]|uniref:Uncharacterized protein n=1 Tax=Clostridium intestinale DSM 6191 TaxID=1121320 RepID=A0A1M5V0I0_9CLOT|nr:hypothetical protein [Clostridium intestinale]SHH68739.1 hypothetical protein SAMN02745941_00715 [Clostridium intestinale DSM 6191]
MVKKTSKKNENIIDLGFEDYVEENGFSDVISGTPVSSFSFTNTSTEPVTFNSKPSLAAETNLVDNRVGKPCANGIIPPVNNEYFDIKRTLLENPLLGSLMNLKPCILILTPI